MRFAAFWAAVRPRVAVLDGQVGYPGSIDGILQSDRAEPEAYAASLGAGDSIDPERVDALIPMATPGKIVSVGLNNCDHTAESGMQQPAHLTLFPRLTSSLVAHDRPIVRQTVSDKPNCGGELVAVVGCGDRHIARGDAAGLRLQTRSNGIVMQSASTDDLVFDVKTPSRRSSKGSRRRRATRS